MLPVNQFSKFVFLPPLSSPLKVPVYCCDKCLAPGQSVWLLAAPPRASHTANSVPVAQRQGGEGTAIRHFGSSEQIGVSSRSRNRSVPTGTVSKSLCCQNLGAVFCLCQKTGLALVTQRVQ